MFLELFPVSPWSVDELHDAYITRSVGQASRSDEIIGTGRRNRFATPSDRPIEIDQEARSHMPQHEREVLEVGYVKQIMTMSTDELFLHVFNNNQKYEFVSTDAYDEIIVFPTHQEGCTILTINPEVEQNIALVHLLMRLLEDVAERNNLLFKYDILKQ